MGSPMEARNLTLCFMLIRLNSAEIGYLEHRRIWRRASKSARATKIDILYSGTHSSRAWYDCWRTMTMTRLTSKYECEDFSSNLPKAGAEFQGFDSLP